MSELEQAREAARAMWRFILAGEFLDQVGFEWPDTPGYELWLQKWTAIGHATACKDWLQGGSHWEEAEI